MAAESAPLLDQIENDNQFENDNESNASETSSLMGRDVERGRHSGFRQERKKPKLLCNLF